MVTVMVVVMMIAVAVVVKVEYGQVIGATSRWLCSRHAIHSRQYRDGIEILAVELGFTRCIGDI